MKVGILKSLVLGTTLAATSAAVPTAVQAEGDGKQEAPAYRSNPYSGWSDEQMRGELQRRLEVRKPNNHDINYYNGWTSRRMQAQLEVQDEAWSIEKSNRGIDPAEIGLLCAVAGIVVGALTVGAIGSHLKSPESIRKDLENK